MATLTLHQGDNLATLQRLADAGERFDLIELDGPYGAGLEEWDRLTEEEYIAHYAPRLALVRQLLQPWGVVFFFGYPEMCAEIKAWARQTGTLHLRRWLTWYKQVTAHKGRKCETVLMFIQPEGDRLFDEFKVWLNKRRVKMRVSLRDALRLTGINLQHADRTAGGIGGWLWYEAESSTIPTRADYAAIKRVFDTPDRYDVIPNLTSFDGLTNLDYIGRHYPEDTRDLNDAGLRSKPVGLYLDLFRPVVPPRDTKRALVLYGGSGNAAIAAGRLGYAVDICEADVGRCDLIRRRWAWGVDYRDETPVEEMGPLFAFDTSERGVL